MALSCLVVNFFGPMEKLKNKTSHFRFTNILYMPKRMWTLCINMLNVPTGINPKKVKRHKFVLKMQKVDST